MFFFHGQSCCIPVLQRWSYARHSFAYLKWEGELNMFMSYLISSDVRSEGSIAIVKKFDFDFFTIFGSTSPPTVENVF